MEVRRNAFSILAIAILILLAVPLKTHAEEAKHQEPNAPNPLGLEELERMAMENNPTLAQAAADVRSAEGRKVQAGMYPNPTIGYSGEEISTRDPGERSIHSIFIEQRIVTAGKLRLSREVFAHELEQAAVEQEAQRTRILNDVAIAYYQALGAQDIVKLRRELAGIAREAVEVTRQLYNIGQADRPDVLAAEVETQRAELDLVSAENQLDRVWLWLASVVGTPDLPMTTLEGELDGDVPELDREAIITRLLSESLQVKMARTQVERAGTTLQRAEAGRYPDITLKAGYTYNSEPDESQVLFGVAVPLPVFDRNQGGIASARAELDRARKEITRLELALRGKFASVYAQYRNSLRMVERYRTVVLPRAEEAFDLYVKGFRKMTAAYPQVLIAQRSLFHARVEYVQALVSVRQNIAMIEGLLLTGALDAPGLMVALPAGM